ncbi:MAG TPA: bifunctional DNA-formamidopyrimidine glycosylase/DNA-(apurinic or apyrimidinic site) lyase [Aestuariivirga sp.]|nr:bifunctional DNA-formamidopyrimidine glycosylase/DNA-(apurinic or apyrimidinic site) lyase [Aestuariivirga sp.]
MPELPEVEIVMRGLKPVLEGRRITAVAQRRKDLRFPFPKDFAARLTGKRVTGLSRRAKYILGSLEGGDCLLIHLGMTGRFTVVAPSGAARSLDRYYFEEGAGEGGNGTHDHVVFSLDDGTRIIYTDARRFGMMDLFSEAGEHKLLRGIGVEPLGNGLNAAFLADAFRGKKAPLKAALLDQRIIAGLGNIYVCEALHRAKLSPLRKAGTLVRGSRIDPRLETLVRHIRDVLNDAIEAGGSTLQDFAHTNGNSGDFQERFAVYDREGKACGVCGTAIKRIVQAGRSTFYCRTCQK